MYGARDRQPIGGEDRKKSPRSTSNPAVPDNGVNQVQHYLPSVSDLVLLPYCHDGTWSE